jgi:hypothetical protein
VGDEVFVYGGGASSEDDAGFGDDAIMWDPSDGSSRSLDPPPLDPLRTPSAVNVGDEAVVLAGVACPATSPVAELPDTGPFAECDPGSPGVAVFDLSTSTWRAAPMPPELAELRSQSVQDVFEFPWVQAVGSVDGHAVLDISSDGGELWALAVDDLSWTPVPVPQSMTPLVPPDEFPTGGYGYSSCSTEDAFVLLPRGQAATGSVSVASLSSIGGQWTTSQPIVITGMIGGVACSDRQALVYPVATDAPNWLLDPNNGSVTDAGKAQVARNGVASMTWVGDEFVAALYDGSGGVAFRPGSGWRTTSPWPSLTPGLGPIVGAAGAAVYVSAGSIDPDPETRPSEGELTAYQPH